RRAVQAHVVQRRADALHAGLVNVETQLQAAGLLEQVVRNALNDLKALEVDEEKLVGEGEIFLQVAITAEGIERVGNQRLILGESHRLDLLGGELQGRQRPAIGAGQWFALLVQWHQLDATQVAQQAEVEQLTDVGLARQVQTQMV